MTLLLAWFVAGVLAGSIPFGYLIGRFVYRTDIRTQGSGNIGAMNALRTLGRAGAIAVLLLDAAKGFIPTWFAANTHDASSLAAAAGIGAILGHCFSPWLGFKGGKGVATSFGVIFAMDWRAGLACVAIWILGALIVTRFSSVGSMAANLLSAVALWWFSREDAYVLYGIVAGLLIVWAHRENIARLAAGTENRIKL